MPRSTRLLAALTGSLVLSNATPAQHDLVPKEGEVFPELAFPTLDGKSASLRAFRGRKVLLLQFASW